MLLIFSLEPETSGVAVQGIPQNSEKWLLLPVRIFLVKMTLRPFYVYGANISEAVEKIATD